MTTAEIKQIVLSADPQAKRYESTKDGKPFTIWAEYRRIMPDGAAQEDYGWAFEIDRYAVDADDDIASAIETALAGDDRVSFRYDVEYDAQHGYIRHIFDCEGI